MNNIEFINEKQARELVNKHKGMFQFSAEVSAKYPSSKDAQYEYLGSKGAEHYVINKQKVAS